MIGDALVAHGSLARSLDVRELLPHLCELSLGIGGSSLVELTFAADDLELALETGDLLAEVSRVVALRPGGKLLGLLERLAEDVDLVIEDVERLGSTLFDRDELAAEVGGLCHGVMVVGGGVF